MARTSVIVLALAAVSMLWLPPGAATADGSYRKEYPPWGEPGTAMYGKPRFNLPILVPLTRNGCGPSRYMSMRIAASHVNRRDATFCPAIRSLKNDFEVAYEVADSGGNSKDVLVGMRDLQARMKAKGMPPVKVVLGPNGSGASMALSAFLGGLNVPHISWAATSAKLSNKATYNNFFRVVSPDSLTMHVLALLLVTFGFTETNLIYFDAPFQSGQAADFRDYASKLGVHIKEFRLPNSGQGGKGVSEANRPMMVNTLDKISAGPCRVVVAFAINKESYDLWKAAYDRGAVHDHGWAWFGGDGIDGGQLAGDVGRVKVFEGTLYILPMTASSRFKTYSEHWAQDMPSTDTPEFHTMALCSGGVKCLDHPEFIGWTAGIHNQKLECNTYAGLAYDAFVTLMVVLDRLLTSKSGNISDISKGDWMTELRALSDPSKAFLCVTGEIVLDMSQDRVMPMALKNYHAGDTAAVTVGSWSGRSGFSWQVGATVLWPSGDQAVIENAKVLPGIPSGHLPTQGGTADDGDDADSGLLIIGIVITIIVITIAIVALVILVLFKKFGAGSKAPVVKALVHPDYKSEGPLPSSGPSVSSDPSAIIPKTVGASPSGEDAEARAADPLAAASEDRAAPAAHRSISDDVVRVRLCRPSLAIDDIGEVLATIAAGGTVSEEVHLLKGVYETILRSGESKFLNGNPRTKTWKEHLDTIRVHATGEAKVQAVRILCLMGLWGDDDLRRDVIASIKSTLIKTGDDRDWLQVAEELGNFLLQNKCNEEDIMIATNGLLEGLSKSRRVEGVMNTFNDLVGPPCKLCKATNLVVNQACLSLSGTTSCLDKEPKVYIARMLGNWIAKDALEEDHKKAIKEKMLQIVQKCFREEHGQANQRRADIVELASCILQQQFDTDLENSDLLGEIEKMIGRLTTRMGQIELAEATERTVASTVDRACLLL